ncbi:probable jasmonic acid carboxyl methyltransferase 2 [Hordeum vulgare subsp. vulgare]|uniref:Jasmonate O-methyltransferase n=2 Tax=Hordeum vulgare subsp. vulgare TaxID=112509 RepID=A0A8I6YE83_HORVV|nr:probable jasmonic acid carboxyl methyltransferase 2 [Hordeum vulgare subsp. vulgare]
MASDQTVHMNGGQGETSYARNSSLQNAEQNRVRPLIEEAIADLLSASASLPRSMVVADLGCSSGPNALALVSICVDAIRSQRLRSRQPPVEVCVFLNDLPDNDFNMVVKSLVTFQQSHKSVVTGVMPGSFYGRLFTSGSLHLVCSANSLHWLSEAPEELRRNKIPAYDIDEHVRRGRRSVVIGAYARQFRKDFTLFLELRAKELVAGGRLVVSLAGRRSEEPAAESTHAWESVALILSEMTSKGMVNRAKFDSFYIPIYGPSDVELREIIQAEGSFSIREMQVHEPTSNVESTLISPSKIANLLRAGFEPIIVQHFGSSEEIMDGFVRAAEQRWSRHGSLEEEMAGNPRVMLVVSLKLNV